MAQGKVTFHHLNHSQSQRIFWLLEELVLASPADNKFEYDLVLHERVKDGPQKHRAPSELAEIHPLGKAPQLVTPEGRVLIESSTIAKYLIDTFDTTDSLKGEGAGMDALRDDMLTSFANASLAIPTMLDMFLGSITKMSPFFIRPIFRATHTQVRKMFAGPEFAKMFKWLNGELEGREWFMGSKPGRADFMLSWEIDFITAAGMFEDFSKPEYSKVKAWHEMVKARPAYQSALQKGNGYQLSFQ
ncbi:Hypothetical protein R9X50_00143600 [Acrodontium crateriforme]|uniref:Glutathione S-transferase n=1 Tax=Acrodontium crateriforme TaxID=150365 RepID=A0AAQ3LZH2_9PEZI|nr:Hypothetical protein R9X50_00143600 [Acrodontium crateriforme]